jgi:CubicO group peptidase (beta-lactamase class C family)
MRASIADFDEWSYQREHPLVDMSPALIVEKYAAGTTQSLDTCGAYTSMGYTLLGLLLINVSGSDQWSDYDQNVWRKQFPDIDFGVLGPCRNYTDLSGKQNGYNFLDFSCTAGYSCGNLVARPITVAAFVKDLFEGKLLKKESLQEMMRYRKLGEGCDSGRAWGQGAPYGLGVMGNPVSFTADRLKTRIPGHRGSTYGYVSLAAYDTEAKASISVAAGSMVNGAKLELWKDVHKAFLDRWPLREKDEDLVAERAIASLEDDAELAALQESDELANELVDELVA